MPATESIGFVCLVGGWSVPLPALRLLWDLEDRGFGIRVDGRQLVVSPAAQLTASDDAQIRRHRDALVALVDRCRTESVQ